MTSGSGRRILVIAQHSVHQPGYGGAEVYLRNLVEELPDHEYLGLIMTNRRFGSEYRLQRLPSGETLHTFHLSGGAKLRYDALSHSALDGVLEQALSMARPDLVLVNSLIGFSLTAFHVLDDLGIPYVTIHQDYFALCDHPNLLHSETGLFCGLEGPGYPGCGTCAITRFPQGYSFRSQRLDIHERRRIMRGVAMGARTNVVSLPSVRWLIGQGLDLDDHHFTLVRPSRRHIAHRMRPPADSRPERGAALHIAILGAALPHKGAVIMREAMAQLDGEEVHWHFFGEVSREIDRDPSPRVHRHGRYDSVHELPSGLAACQLGLVASPWPETYCYVLDEVVAAGLVPLVRRSSTLTERCLPSYSFDFDDLESLLRTIRFAASHPEAVAARRAGLAAHWTLNPETFADQMSPILAIEARESPRVAGPPGFSRSSHSLLLGLGAAPGQATWGSALLTSWIPVLESLRRLAESAYARLRRLARVRSSRET